MKVMLCSTADNSGGAARAVFRLHNALLSNNVQSNMNVAVKNTDYITVKTGDNKYRKIVYLVRSLVGRLFSRLQNSNNSALRSVSILPSGQVKKINNSSVDIVNLHWVCDEFLSIEDIGKLRKPMVWTLHDMWPFCGAEHYSSDGINARWRVGYSKKNRSTEDGGLDIDSWVWNRKVKEWAKSIHIISPSNWLANCAKESFLMRDWPIHVIPNPLNTELFKPWPSSLAREMLGLPESTQLVMFGALGGTNDPRKGWDLLQESLVNYLKNNPNIEIVIFGQSQPVEPPNIETTIHWMGHIHDDITLALLYSAVDVMLVPSRQENLPQSATEAQSCGCPVVAYNCTGFPDVVEHKVTGYLAEPYITEDFSLGISWVLENDTRLKSLKTAARERAEEFWSYDVVIPKYIEIYESIISENNKTNF